MKKQTMFKVEFPTNYGTWYTKLTIATSHREAINITYNGVGRDKQRQKDLYKSTKTNEA
jgi:hypothetical protein